jgi:hypothetical protein
MTEERRIIVSEHGALTCLYPTDNNIPVWEFSKNFSPEPITKSEFKDIVNNYMFGFKEIINFIGVDEFWNKYGKPVPEEKYFVYVPHTNCETYCKNDLGLAVVSDDTDLDNCEFTEAEIKKYHLEDCKKELVDDK